MKTEEPARAASGRVVCHIGHITFGFGSGRVDVIEGDDLKMGTVDNSHKASKQEAAVAGAGAAAYPIR